MNRNDLTKLQEMLGELDPDETIVDEAFIEVRQEDGARVLHVSLTNGNSVQILGSEAPDYAEEELGLRAQAILQIGDATT